jgi:hypothetical protein
MFFILLIAYRGCYSKAALSYDRFTEPDYSSPVMFVGYCVQVCQAVENATENVVQFVGLEVSYTFALMVYEGPYL